MPRSGWPDGYQPRKHAPPTLPKEGPGTVLKTLRGARPVGAGGGAKSSAGGRASIGSGTLAGTGCRSTQGNDGTA